MDSKLTEVDDENKTNSYFVSMESDCPAAFTLIKLFQQSPAPFTA